MDHFKKSCFKATHELSQLTSKHKNVQEQLTRSEDDLKNAEIAITSLKAKLNKLKYSKGQGHHGHSSGSFIETPKRQDSGTPIFTKTPKLPSMSNIENETPEINSDSRSKLITKNIISQSTDIESKLTKNVCSTYSNSTCSSSSTIPSIKQTSNFVDLDDSCENLNQSFDLFEESPRTQVKKACEENNVKVVKISSASDGVKASKKRRLESEELASGIQLSTMNIMKNRSRTGQLLGKTVMRKDYNGLGGTSSFVKPLGAPKFNVPKNVTSKVKKTKNRNFFKDPALPTLDNFIDLS